MALQITLDHCPPHDAPASYWQITTARALDGGTIEVHLAGWPSADAKGAGEPWSTCGAVVVQAQPDAVTDRAALYTAMKGLERWKDATDC